MQVFILSNNNFFHLPPLEVTLTLALLCRRDIRIHSLIHQVLCFLADMQCFSYKMSLKHLKLKLSTICPCVVKKIRTRLFRQSTHKLLYVWEREREALLKIPSCWEG